MIIPAFQIKPSGLYLFLCIPNFNVYRFLIHVWTKHSLLKMIKPSMINTYFFHDYFYVQSQLYCFNSFTLFKHPLVMLLLLWQKESVHEDMMPHKTAYYNSVHGEIYFPETSCIYHLWSWTAASKSTFSDPLNIKCNLILSKTKGWKLPA